MWQQIEAQRQTRSDYMIEVKVRGNWYLAYTLEWAKPTTLPRPNVVGQWVKIPE